MSEADWAWHPALSADERRARDLAAATQAFIADTVGIECEGCGGHIQGRDGIGAWCWMAPFGSRDFSMRGYCVSCADALWEGMQ